MRKFMSVVVGLLTAGALVLVGNVMAAPVASAATQAAAVPVLLTPQAVPAAVNSQKPCGVSIKKWEKLTPINPDTVLFHGVLLTRRVKGKMELCLIMVADKAPKGRKMTIDVKKPGKDVKESTTSGSLAAKATIGAGQEADGILTFTYKNPARPNGIGKYRAVLVIIGV